MPGLIRPSRWFQAALLLLLLSSAGEAQPHLRKRVERSQITALEEQWRKAQLAEDIPVMDHLLSDDFLGVNASGEVVTKGQQLDRMRTRQIDLRQLDVSDTKIKISGKLAVVTSLARLDGTSNGRPLAGYFRYTRVYQHKTGDGWKITNFEATRVRQQTERSGAGASSPGEGSGVPLVSVPSSPPATQVVSGSPRPRS